MDNQKIEEYIEKIHQRWLNARDVDSFAVCMQFHSGLKTAYHHVENELTKMLKEEKPIIRIRTPKLKRIGDVLVETADIKKEV